MKWFKHDTDSFTSEGVAYLISHTGFAGYGRWFRLLELVAFKMDATSKCSLEYPSEKWIKLLGLKKKKLYQFLKILEEKMNVQVEILDSKNLTHYENKVKMNSKCFHNIIKISIPNLLKKRDNYTKDLQVFHQRLASRSISSINNSNIKDNTTSFEIRDINKKKKKSVKDNISITVIPEWIKDNEVLNKAIEDFIQHRKNIKKPMSERAKELFLIKIETFNNKGIDVIACLNEATMYGWQGIYEPKIQKHGNNRTQENLKTFNNFIRKEEVEKY